ncbi:putative inositol monophosphatase 3 [Varroa jacobsoni]|uniref:inositol-phosphate phosphatase n=1 Tax=Varroa destructor TaxID=109461 RepID=A0A7M7K7Q2_VARDE|nr:putative inositol monophosphatase 3 isoform X1 [Varroa destructor]XP_022656867.1 putative inositol monophosphatase 3 isoform X1 [Varroa destructor]XP_022656868.1 putative inositol monophosphatase 3 isoform X1 [Varroa destructor]XP_022656869.1 putative inositol monophosphatase 3 isoform X1 [Varroa destructor]XP_022656871.1 putative inositol monophosphatase 3 isoform X1 [Varroa destructor]XP_022656872.1 putative inositol monophosphatase 3 isoform X1 [Varroa destructor]XP_022656873.1 putative
MVWMKQCRPANLSIVLGLVFVLVLVYYTLYTEMNASRVERVSLRLLLRTSIIAAVRGGNEVVRVRQNGVKTSSKGKNQFGQDDPLTDGDLRSHRAMLKTLLESFPHLNVLSEEHESSRQSQPPAAVLLEEVNLPESISHYADETVRMRDILVWVDPLDATQEYSENLTHFVTTMVCIAIKGRAQIGVIHQPFLNRTVWAWVGQGPSKSLRRINPTEEAESQIRIVVSRSHADKVEAFAKENLSGNIHVTLAGGAGYKVLQVAEGKDDLYVHTSLIKKWDICAGAALLETLGGQMITLKGDAIDFGQRQEEVNGDGVIAFLKDKNDFLRLTRAALPN